MDLKQALNNIYDHMMYNDIVTEEVYDWIKINYPESIYNGEMFRYLACNKVIDTDLLASFSKSKESAKNIVHGMRGELRKNNRILLRQVYEGIDLIKLLRIWKGSYESNSEEKNDIMKLINNFREEKEIVSRLHKYEIIK